MYVAAAQPWAGGFRVFRLPFAGFKNLLHLAKELIIIIEEAQVFTELAGEVIIASSGQHLGESALGLRPDIAVFLYWFKAVAKGIAAQVVDGGLQAKTLVGDFWFQHR